MTYRQEVAPDAACLGMTVGVSICAGAAAIDQKPANHPKRLVDASGSVDSPAAGQVQAASP